MPISYNYYVFTKYSYVYGVSELCYADFFYEYNIFKQDPVEFIYTTLAEKDSS